jgi:hypothetical protein
MLTRRSRRSKRLLVGILGARGDAAKPGFAPLLVDVTSAAGVAAGSVVFAAAAAATAVFDLLVESIDLMPPPPAGPLADVSFVVLVCASGVSPDTTRVGFNA